MQWVTRLLTGFALMGAAADAHAADLSARQVVMAVAAGTPGHPADLSGRDLSELDLADVDFRGANLAGANLFGADLTGARFAGADLAGARLDRAIIIRTDFSHANLRGVTMFLPAASSVYGESPASDAPRFTGTDLTEAHVLGRIGNAGWQGAKFTDAHLDLGHTQFLAGMGSDLSGGRFAGADFSGAVLVRIRLGFADLRGANLAHADLTEADLRDAKLDGADLSGTVLAGADLRGASWRGAVGLDQAVGLDSAQTTNLAAR